MNAKRIYVTDKEVASILEVSTGTLYRIVRRFVRGGSKRRTHGANSVNVMDAKPDSFGGYRRWKVKNLAKVLGVSSEELLGKLN